MSAAPSQFDESFDVVVVGFGLAGGIAALNAQLRGFRQVFDAIPWSDVRDTLHVPVQVPAVPAYSAFVDRAASGQEDLVIAFSELFTAPTSRHVLAFTLAGSSE